MKIEKGQYNYITYKKKSQFLSMLAMLVIGVVIFFIGLLLSKMSKANIFTVIAVLMVLPGANYLTRFIVLFPYKSPDKKQYDEMALLVDKVDGATLLTDMVITSPEKVMNLDFIVVGNDVVLGVPGKSNQDLNYIEQYLTEGIRKYDKKCRVKFYPEYTQFCKEVKKLADSSKRDKKGLDQTEELKEDKSGSEKREDVLRYLKSLVVE